MDRKSARDAAFCLLTVVGYIVFMFFSPLWLIGLGVFNFVSWLAEGQAIAKLLFSAIIVALALAILIAGVFLLTRGSPYGRYTTDVLTDY